jgi:hypothetical protein
MIGLKAAGAQPDAESPALNLHIGYIQGKDGIARESERHPANEDAEPNRVNPNRDQLEREVTVYRVGLPQQIRVVNRRYDQLGCNQQAIEKSHRTRPHRDCDTDSQWYLFVRQSANQLSAHGAISFTPEVTSG